MPVAIRSLNGYYGFLDSLRSLEMTTVTAQIPVYRAVQIIVCTPLYPLPGSAAERSGFKIYMLAGGKLTFSRVSAKLTGVECGK